MKTILIALLLAASLSTVAQDNSKYLNVMAVNGLNMRSRPEADARIMTKLVYGKRAEILEKTKVKLQLGWVEDQWYRMHFRGRDGYVFGGYLTGLPVPAKNIGGADLPALLHNYAIQHFKSSDRPIVTEEPQANGDTLVHRLEKFESGIEMELEAVDDRITAMLLLPYSVKDAYILLEALLKNSGREELLKNLRFVQNRAGDLVRISTADGTVLIKEFADDRTAFRVTSHKE